MYNKQNVHAHFIYELVATELVEGIIFYLITLFQMIVFISLIKIILLMQTFWRLIPDIIFIEYHFDKNRLDYLKTSDFIYRRCFMQMISLGWHTVSRENGITLTFVAAFTRSRQLYHESKDCRSLIARWHWKHWPLIREYKE